MLPELLRFSSRSRLLDIIPEELKAVHRTRESGTHAARSARAVDHQQQLMDGWITSNEGVVEEVRDEDEDEADRSEPEVGDQGFDDGALAALGL